MGVPDLITSFFASVCPRFSPDNLSKRRGLVGTNPRDDGDGHEVIDMVSSRRATETAKATFRKTVSVGILLTSLPTIRRTIANNRISTQWYL
jgi:hypothetical protein